MTDGAGAVLNLPAWSEPSGNVEHQGMWPLGLEPVGFLFVDQLLPGFTNTTTRVRYYSFFSWVFWTYREFVEQSGREPTREEQQRWRARMENIFRAATLYARPDVVGLVGRTDVPDLPDDPREPYSIAEDRGQTAFQPAQYSSSFRALGCADERDGVVELTRQTGARLAQAFEDSLRRDGLEREEQKQLVSLSPTLPTGLIRGISDAFSLSKVPSGTNEHEELTNLLFRNRNPRERRAWRAQDRSRSQSLALILEVVRQSDDGVDSRMDFHPLFASGRLPDGIRFDVPDVLEVNWLRWRRYQERQFEKRALYAFFCESWFSVKEGIQHPSAILHRLSRLANRSSRLEVWVGKSGLSVRVREAEDRILERYRQCRRDPDWSIETLSRAVYSAGHEDRVGLALVLFLLVTVLWRERSEKLPEWAVKMHREYGLKRLALDVVEGEVEARSHYRLDVFLRWLVETYVFSQSFLIAGEKLARDKKFRFFLVHGDEGYEIIKTRNPTGYMDYDAPRIRGASRLMNDLGILETDVGGWSLTGRGGEVLSRVLKYLRTGSKDTAVADG